MAKQAGAGWPSDTRKIAYVITGLSYGGAETQLTRLALELKRRGWRIMVISMLPPLAYQAELADARIEVVSLGMRRGKATAGALLKAARIIRRWRPDIVHSFMLHANVLARLSRPLHRAPIQISSARNTYEGGRVRMLAYRITDPLCDLTTQVSNAGSRRYVKIRAVPANKMLSMPNGVDTDAFAPCRRRREQARHSLEAGDTFVWLATGRLERQKDYPNLLRAFARLPVELEDGRRIILAIVGTGSLEDELVLMCASLGVESRVRFLGSRNDMPAVMNAADAFVLASSWEGMPNTLLEASATGLPVVATAVGGSREVVIDGRTGFLVPPHDPTTLADAMHRAIRLPVDERRRMGEAGRAFMEARFSLSRVATMWEGLYVKLLDEKRGIHG